MRTLLTGQQGTPAQCPANRAFFFIILFLFFGGSSFSSKKKLYFLSVFSFFLSLSLFYTLWVLLSLMNFTEVRCEGKLKKGVPYKL
jgi:hypothetical protein